MILMAVTPGPTPFRVLLLPGRDLASSASAAPTLVATHGQLSTGWHFLWLNAGTQHRLARRFHTIRVKPNGPTPFYHVPMRSAPAKVPRLGSRPSGRTNRGRELRIFQDMQERAERMTIPLAKRLAPAIVVLGIAGGSLGVAAGPTSGSTTTTTAPVALKTGSTCTKSERNKTIKIGSTTLVCKQITVYRWQKKS